jgi:hypothetical protein
MGRAGDGVSGTTERIVVLVFVIDGFKRVAFCVLREACFFRRAEAVVWVLAPLLRRPDGLDIFPFWVVNSAFAPAERKRIVICLIPWIDPFPLFSPASPSCHLRFPSLFSTGPFNKIHACGRRSAVATVKVEKHDG